MRSSATLVVVAIVGVTLGAATAATIERSRSLPAPGQQQQAAAPLLDPLPPSASPSASSLEADGEPVADAGGPPAGEGVPQAPGPGPSVLPAAGDGTFTTAPGRSAVVGEGDLLTFTVESEVGSGVTPAAFAAVVESILFDPRSWVGGQALSLQRVDSGPVDFTVTLATPATVDDECRPLTTNGTYSCWNGERTMLNLWRWYEGAAAYGSDLTGYRRYLVNHEVGHALGQPHEGCAAQGEPAPVMMQQTISVGNCLPSPWPYPDQGPPVARSGPIA